MPSMRHNITPSTLLLACDENPTPGVDYVAHGGLVSGDYTVSKNFGPRPTGTFKVPEVGTWYVAFTVELGAASSGFSNEVSSQVGHL